MIQKRTFENVKETIKTIIANQMGVDFSTITDDSVLTTDHGADSLDHVELVMWIEEEFGIDVDDSKANEWDTAPFIDIVTQVAKQLGIEPAGVAA